MLRHETHGRVAVLTMDAPERLNVLSDAMLAALQEALDGVAANGAVHAVVLRGSGRAFCAGHDLREMQSKRQAEDGGRAAFADLFARCSRLMQTIPRMPQPVIAEVSGIATAAGCQLVASCDMAIAETGARFGVNGVNIGLFCSTPMVALSRVAPPKAVFEMLTTGRLIGADEAVRIGLVNRAVAPDALHAEALGLAETVAAKLGTAVAIGKAAFYTQMGMSTADAYAYTGDVITRNMMDPDTDEGVTAFLQKRDPDWS